MSKGFQCKLFRIDGSHKHAVIDIDDEYCIRAYKYPNGEVKSKYVFGLRKLRDWNFFYNSNDEVWKQSVFNKDKAVFKEKTKIENCVTILGSQKWGEFTSLNVEFFDE